MMRQYELVEKVKAYDPHADEALLNRAYVYAMQMHGQQKRASGDPYISHPLEVAAILVDLKLDDATIASALLHDTIEDTSATRDEIDKMFGGEIGALVDGLTKIAKLDLVTRKAEQAENFRKLLIAITSDVRVLLVKLADRLHNMRTLEHVRVEKRKRIAEETMDIYAPLAARMGMQELREELEDLAFKTLNPEAHDIVVKRLVELREVNKGLIEEIKFALEAKFSECGIKARGYPSSLPQTSHCHHFRCSRAAREAGGPAPQYAHAGTCTRRKTQAHRGRDDGYLRASRRAHGHAGIA